MNDSVSVLNIGILVFREGLECVLVLAAITANMTGERQEYRRLIALGAFAGFIATLVTWDIAARILRDLRQNISALSLQAGTGLLAVVVLLIVMNWFFHRTYWTGWISLHNKRKRQLLGTTEHSSRTSLFFGFALLGFTSFYREGFEVVLFLQSYRLEMAARPMLEGILIGLVCTLIVGVLTFFAHRKLPYKRMLVFTGVLLALVLFVMVGEQIQEIAGP
jgi:high-affinity iron transporter